MGFQGILKLLLQVFESFADGHAMILATNPAKSIISSPYPLPGAVPPLAVLCATGGTDTYPIRYFNFHPCNISHPIPKYHPSPPENTLHLHRKNTTN